MSKCDFCSKNFEYKKNLKKHFYNVHHLSNSFQCPQCPKKLKHKRSLKNHMESVHLGLKKFQCNLCLKCFAQKHSRIQHIQIVHDKLKPFECSICFKNFSIRQLLKRHMSKHHEQLGSSQCNVKSGEKESLENQSEDAHKHFEKNEQNNSKEKKLRNKKCSETFGDPSSNKDLLPTKSSINLQRETNKVNRKQKEPEGEKVFENNNFGEDFKSDVKEEDEDEIIFLKEIKQTESSGYECDICDEDQVDGRSLKDHFRRSHSSDRAFLCKICQERFTEEVDFKLHNEMDH